MIYTAGNAANEIREIMDKIFVYVCTDDNSGVFKDIISTLDRTAKALEEKAEKDRV